MQMIQGAIAVLLAVAVVSSAAGTNSTTAAIRSFDIKTIESLGRQIYEQDAYAARATDILFEHVGGPERLSQKGLMGWIVSEQNEKVVVRFVREENDTLVAVYDVTFLSPKQGEVSLAWEKRLSTSELAQFNARQLALKNIPEPCSDNYNFVVLPNVGGKGFLVYALAATTDSNLVFVGGHYRFTVSPNGGKIERTDRLFKTCLVLDKRDIPAGVEAAGLFASHVVSDTPVETHVFLSLLNNQSLLIVTMDGTIWKIDDGRITNLGNASSKDKAANKPLDRMR